MKKKPNQIVVWVITILYLAATVFYALVIAKP